MWWKRFLSSANSTTKISLSVFSIRRTTNWCNIHQIPRILIWIKCQNSFKIRRRKISSMSRALRTLRLAIKSAKTNHPRWELATTLTLPRRRRHQPRWRTTSAVGMFSNLLTDNLQLNLKTLDSVSTCLQDQAPNFAPLRLVRSSASQSPQPKTSCRRSSVNLHLPESPPP